MSSGLMVISGGQVGVDKGGLLAARELGLSTGGFCPRDYRIKGGYDPSLAEFGLCPLRSAAYPPRTRANVRLADATLILVTNPKSSGTAVTRHAACYYKRPYLIVNMLYLDEKRHEEILTFLRVNLPKDSPILNIAGNSIPALQDEAATVCMKILRSFIDRYSAL